MKFTNDQINFALYAVLIIVGIIGGLFFANAVDFTNFFAALIPVIEFGIGMVLSIVGALIACGLIVFLWGVVDRAIKDKIDMEESC